MKKIVGIFLFIFLWFLIPSFGLSEETVIHIVKKGETLEKIAKKYGVSIEELKKLNNLKKSKISIGQKLIISKKEEKKKLSEKEKKEEKEKKVFSEVEKQLKQLEERTKKLETQASKNKKVWLEVINEYRRIYLLYPGSKYASECLLKTADLYYKLYKKFGSQQDLKEAIKKYELLTDRYPKSEEMEETYFKLAQIYKQDLNQPEKAKIWEERLEKEFPKSKYLVNLKAQLKNKKASRLEKKSEKTVDIQEKPKVEKISKTKKEVKEPSEAPSQKEQAKKEITSVGELKKITGIKPISGEDYTRIIIESSGHVEYQANILKETKSNPPRIYVDLFPALIDSSIPKELDIKNSHLTRIRIGQFDKHTVRVVLDLTSLTSYKIFSLKNPYQLILDLTGTEIAKLQTPKTSFKKRPKKGDSQSYINLARQFGLGVKKVVIDAGHGGEDPGAINPSNGLKEKELTLKLAKILKEKLESSLGIEVILTRDRDVFIPIAQRPAIANSQKADLFISLHFNASPDPKAKGVEVYYLNFTTDPEAMRVAALENAMSEKGLSDLYDLVKAILANTKLSESKLLAEKVQKELVRTLSRYYPYVEDRGVKYAPFLVLIGTRMPAILVEAGFITNSLEAELLKKDEFLEKIAEGITKGIEVYIQSLKFSSNSFKSVGRGS